MSAKMYSKYFHKQLVQLKANVLVNDRSVDYGAGICNNIRMTDDVCKLAKKWPERSNDYSFPVPSYDPFIDSFDMYMRCSNVWIGEYGAARMRLLDFLIEETK